LSLFDVYATLGAMRHRILMVDDEAPTRELYAVYFQARGFDVQTTATPSEALRLIKAEPFDLILLDVSLANANGLDLIPPIKELKPELPILIYTGRAFDDETKKRALDLGARGVIGKTEPLDYLIRMIQKNIPATK
jgi:DNA-binding response OmpR family regulator